MTAAAAAPSDTPRQRVTFPGLRRSESAKSCSSHCGLYSCFLELPARPQFNLYPMFSSPFKREMTWPSPSKNIPVVPKKVTRAGRPTSLNILRGEWKVVPAWKRGRWQGLRRQNQRGGEGFYQPRHLGNTRGRRKHFACLVLGVDDFFSCGGIKKNGDGRLRWA